MTVERPRREEILRTASRIFREKTYHGTSLQDIADAVGMQKGSLYYYFNSKEELLGSIVTEALAVIDRRLADISTELEAARLLVYKAAYLADQGQPFRTEAARAKVYASELAMKASVFGVQVFGGYGYMMDSPMQRYFRDAKLTEIYEGTSEVQRLVISNALFR